MIRGLKNAADIAAGLKFSPPHPDAERKQAEHAEQQRNIKIACLRGKWNAPELQSSRTKLDRSGEWAAKEQELKSKIGTGFCVGMIGKRGPGKTQMAVEVMREATAQLRSAYYTHVIEFFMDIKATYGGEVKSKESDAVKKYIAPDLLVIDEVGERGETTWEDRMLAYLIDKRYQGVKDSILISNHPLDEFLKSVGPSIASRMKETGGIIKCEWKSYR